MLTFINKHRTFYEFQTGRDRQMDGYGLHASMESPAYEQVGQPPLEQSAAKVCNEMYHTGKSLSEGRIHQFPYRLRIIGKQDIEEIGKDRPSYHL